MSSPGFHKSVLEFLSVPYPNPKVETDATNEACKWALERIKELEIENRTLNVQLFGHTKGVEA
jgi:hypothetical protein